MAFAKSETAIFNDTRLEIIRHKGSIWAAYAGNRKFENSKSRKHTLKQIFEAIDIQG